MSTYPTIERDDWRLFASLKDLPQKAGVSADLLRRMVLKELTDNALDAGGAATISEPEYGRYVIEDDGPGIPGEPEQIARMFSINRPLASSKLWRKPLRGALGNGLRVVAGALIASGGGSLVVTTNNQRLALTPQADGGVAYTAVAADHSRGTRIEISFGRHLPQDNNALLWARYSIEMSNGGESYDGNPSALWHDAESFFELINGVGDIPLFEFVKLFDVCTGRKGRDIANSQMNRPCSKMIRETSDRLLKLMHENSRQVSFKRLGCVGKLDSLPPYYAKEEGEIVHGKEPQAHIPFIVEAWAETSARSSVTVFVNRTPIADHVGVAHYTDKTFCITGCALNRVEIDAPKKGRMAHYAQHHDAIHADHVNRQDA